MTNAELKAIVPLCLLMILAGRIFLWTETGRKVDQSIRAYFSKIEEDKRFSARFLMFCLRHPSVLIPVVLVVIGACLVLYTYLTY